MNNDLKYWEKAAEEYDHLQGESGDFFRQSVINPIITEMLGDISGKKILDAGCGNGYLTNILSQLQAEVIGIDGSSLMINKAKQNFPNQKFIIADLTQPLSFKNEEFDHIVCSMILQAIENPFPVLKEFYRILKAKGNIVITIPHPCFAYPVGVARRGVWGKIFKSLPKLIITDYITHRQVNVPLQGMKNSTNRYHRTLSYYWQLFQKANFVVIALEEPTIKNTNLFNSKNKKKIRKIFNNPDIPFVLIIKLLKDID